MRTDTKFLKCILILSFIGVLVAGWLLSVHIKFTSGQASLTESCSMLPGSAGQGCAAVAVSNFSDIAGIPLASIAMGFYFAIFFLALWSIRNPQSNYETLHTGFFLSTLSILVTITMAYISHFILKSFCIGCSTLWIVNLALWPCFVKHMKLSWGNALAANLELFLPKQYQLKRPRLAASFSLSFVCLVIFAAIGSAAENMQREDSMFGGDTQALQNYQSAKIVFLPPEAYGGAQSKGGLENKAPVLDIVEFSDLQCPACRMAARFLKPFLMKYPSQVRFSYRHYPLDNSCNAHINHVMHLFACEAAKAAICAAKQNKFFEYHDLVFDNQDALSSNFILELAKIAGLDMPAFNACVQDKATEAELQKQIEWGERVGLESTPTLIINGHKLTGAISPSQLEALFQSVLHDHR